MPPKLETQKCEGASRLGEYHPPGLLRVQRHADRLRLFANAFERSVGPAVTLRRVVRQDDHVIEVPCIGEVAVSSRESVVQVVQHHVCQERRERRPLRDAPLARAFQELPDEPQHLLVTHPSGHFRQHRRVPDVVEEALQVHVEHKVLLVNQSRTHFSDGVVGRASRPRTERVSREIGFEDWFQQEPECAVDHAVSNRRDRDYADLAAFLWNLPSSIRSRAVRARAQLRCELREELRSATLLDRLERLAVGPGCAAVALRLQVRRFKRRGLHEVYVQPPESMLGGRLRPMAYPLLKFLRCYRGLYHPARLASLFGVPSVGPLRSAGIAPRHRYYEPFRQALAFAALRLAARAATLLPPDFSTGRGALLCFNPWPCARAVAFTPPSGVPSWSDRESPAAFANIVQARRSKLSPFGASTGRSSRRYGPRTRVPAERGFVGGLHPWDFPGGRHPSYAASTSCRFRTFTLRIHGYLQTSHNNSESALRVVATGRKSWLFFGSDDHAEAAANLYSLIASCKLHGIDPERYLAEVIRIMPYWPRARYLELAPAYWAQTRARLDPVDLEAELGCVTVPPVLVDTAQQSPPS